MHSAPVPQSLSRMQLMLATHLPVRKSHVVPAAQSLGRVQPVGGGDTHTPFMQVAGGTHMTPAQLLVVGTHLPPVHICPIGQSPLVMQPVVDGTHMPLTHESPIGHGVPGQPLGLPGMQKPNTH